MRATTSESDSITVVSVTAGLSSITGRLPLKKSRTMLKMIGLSTCQGVCATLVTLRKSFARKTLWTPSTPNSARATNRSPTLSEVGSQQC